MKFEKIEEASVVKLQVVEGSQSDKDSLIKLELKKQEPREVANQNPQQRGWNQLAHLPMDPFEQFMVEVRANCQRHHEKFWAQMKERNELEHRRFEIQRIVPKRNSKKVQPMKNMSRGVKKVKAPFILEGKFWIRGTVLQKSENGSEYIAEFETTGDGVLRLI